MVVGLVKEIHKTVLFLFLSFIILFIITVKIYEGSALQEVIDDYENDDYIQVVNDVVRNTTFNAMELNYTFLLPEVCPDMDIWTTGGFTEVEQGADHLKNVNGTRIWFNNVDRDEGDRIYKDFGANYFDASFHYQFRVYFDSGRTSNPRAYFMVFSEETDSIWNTVIADKNYCGSFIRYKNVGAEWEVSLRMWDGNVFTVDNLDETGGLDMNKWYHVDLIRNGNNITAWYYNNALRTDLDFMLTISAINVDNLRYFHPLNSEDQATGGRAMNLHLNKVCNVTSGGSGYEDDGYFYTTEMISTIGGSTVVLLTNSSIPVSDSITVEFSSDNSTWVDHNGNVGVDIIIEGYEALDLRDLAYSDLYMRYYFTDEGEDSTPRLNQIRVITDAECISGLQNVSGVWTEYNYTSIITLIGVNVSAGGNYLNQTYWLDDYQYNVTESGTPAFDIRFTVENLPDGLMCLEIVQSMSYDGSLGHNFYLQVWNYTSSSWVTIYDIPDDAHPCRWMNATIGCYEQDVIEDGTLLGRYYHPSPANPAHLFNLDFGKLRAFTPNDIEGVTTIIDIPLIVFGLLIGLIIGTGLKSK